MGRKPPSRLFHLGAKSAQAIGPNLGRPLLPAQCGFGLMFRLKVTIEFATVSDVNEIGQLSRQYIEHGLGWRYTPEKLSSLIRDGARNVVVARTGHKLAGFGIMTYREENANLDLLAVKKRYRRRGVGRQIVEWLEEVATTAGIQNVFVQARKLNGGAIRFYNKLNYQVIDEKSGFYKGQETGVIMCKTIRPLFKTT
jgi:ribosomal-protein-alanine N-acetyltransferase